MGDPERAARFGLEDGPETRRMLNNFEIFSSYFVDVFYNHLYLAAVERHRADGRKSLTEQYMAIVVDYAKALSSGPDPHRESPYARTVIDFHKYYKQHARNDLTFDELVSRLAAFFVPDEYQNHLTVHNKDEAVSAALGDLVKTLAVRAGKTMLAEVIDLREERNIQTIRALQDEGVRSLLTTRDRLFANFLSEIGRGDDTVPAAVAEKLKQACRDLASKNARLEKKLALCEERAGQAEAAGEKFKLKAEKEMLRARGLMQAMAERLRAAELRADTTGSGRAGRFPAHPPPPLQGELGEGAADEKPAGGSGPGERRASPETGRAARPFFSAREKASAPPNLAARHAAKQTLGQTLRRPVYSPVAPRPLGRRNETGPHPLSLSSGRSGEWDLMHSRTRLPASLGQNAPAPLGRHASDGRAAPAQQSGETELERLDTDADPPPDSRAGSVQRERKSPARFLAEHAPLAPRVKQASAGEIRSAADFISSRKSSKQDVGDALANSSARAAGESALSPESKGAEPEAFATPFHGVKKVTDSSAEPDGPSPAERDEDEDEDEDGDVAESSEYDSEQEEDDTSTWLYSMPDGE